MSVSQRKSTICSWVSTEYACARGGVIKRQSRNKAASLWGNRRLKDNIITNCRVNLLAGPDIDVAIVESVAPERARAPGMLALCHYLEVATWRSLVCLRLPALRQERVSSEILCRPAWT